MIGLHKPILDKEPILREGRGSSVRSIYIVWLAGTRIHALMYRSANNVVVVMRAGSVKYSQQGKKTAEANMSCPPARAYTAPLGLYLSCLHMYLPRSISLASFRMLSRERPKVQGQKQYAWRRHNPHGNRSINALRWGWKWKGRSEENQAK